MGTRPTIIDVAAAAGVSKSTVSLVLNDSPAVKRETREAVQLAMLQLGYVYNRAAANLRSSQAGLVGLVINDLRNPFFAEFAASVQETLAAAGYAVVLANTNEDPAIQKSVIAAMIEHDVSALIISPAYGDSREVFDDIQRAGVSTVQVLRKVDDRTDVFPFAAPDYLEGSRLATEHLLSTGARRIAFVGGLAGRPVTEERMHGYLALLKARKLQPVVIAGRTSRAFGREAAGIILRDHPDVDAALCFNDLVALGLTTGFAEAGVPVGSRIRTVGCDDIEDASQAFPALSTVHCDVEGFGRNVAETILTWVQTGKRPAPVTRTPVRLVVRASSAV